jgi:hypothetical protein
MVSSPIANSSESKISVRESAHRRREMRKRRDRRGDSKIDEHSLRIAEMKNSRSPKRARDFPTLS